MFFLSCGGPGLSQTTESTGLTSRGINFADLLGPVMGGHLKPVTLKPVSHIVRIVRVSVSAF